MPVSPEPTALSEFCLGVELTCSNALLEFIAYQEEHSADRVVVASFGVDLPGAVPSSLHTSSALIPAQAFGPGPWELPNG